MTIKEQLQSRSESKCELCGASELLAIHEVGAAGSANAEECVLLCPACLAQIEGGSELEMHHWRCLTQSMWSPVPAVQVLAWRMLNRLKSESWANELLETLYLDEETLAWAQAGFVSNQDETEVRHFDSNGALLSSGDTVTLTKDLNVKGANFTAKRGTAVRGISLVPDNPEQIEGRVNGQHIVILTKFVKKSG